MTGNNYFQFTDSLRAVKLLRKNNIASKGKIQGITISDISGLIAA